MAFLSPKTFDDKERKAFAQSGAKELAAWRDEEAYEELTEEETAKVPRAKNQVGSCLGELEWCKRISRIRRMS